MSSICSDFRRQVKREVHSFVQDVAELVTDTGTVVKEVEESVHSNVCHVVGDAVGDTVDGLHGLVSEGLRQLLYPDAIDEDPIAEIQIPHPVGGEMVPLGCKLKICKSGHVIQRVSPNTIAHKLNLRENDVVLQIDEQRISNWALQMVIQYLAEMKTSFTLVIKRKKPNSDEFVFIKIQIQISLEGGKIEVQVTSRVFIKPSPVYGPDVELRVASKFDAYIYQEDPATNYTKYLHIQNNEARVTPLNSTTDDTYKFRIYQLQGWERSVFIVSNETLTKTIEATAITTTSSDFDQHTHAVLSNNPNDDIATASPNDDIPADDRMFYVTSSSGEYQFESVTNRGKFLACDTINGQLVLVDNPGGDRNTKFHAIRADQMQHSPPQNSTPSTGGKPSIIHKSGARDSKPLYSSDELNGKPSLIHK